MQPNAKITIRFDSPQPPKKPAPSRPAPLPGGAAASEEGPLQNDTGRLEQIIRQAGESFAAGGQAPRRADARPVVRDFAEGQAPVLVGEWVADSRWNRGREREPEIEPEIDLAQEIRFRGASGGIGTKDDGPSWWTVFLSAAGAIATGALFGYLLLTLFASTSPSADPAAAGDQSRAPVEAESASTTIAGPASGASGESSTAREGAPQGWPGATYYWLQYGVFRSEEAMNAAVQELRDAGLPGFGDRTDGYRVYAGLAASKSEAEQLASQMPGRDIFIRSIEIDAVAATAAGGDDAFRQWIALSHELADALSRVSVAALQDELPQSLDPSNLAALRQSYDKWQNAAAAVGRLQAPERQNAEAIVQALNAAFGSVEQYERKVSRYHLWRIQANLMEMLAAERDLRASLAASPGESAD